MKQERLYELLQPLFEELQEEYGSPLMKVGVTLDIAWHPFTEYQRARTSHFFKIGNLPDTGYGFEMRVRE